MKIKLAAYSQRDGQVHLFINSSEHKNGIRMTAKSTGVNPDNEEDVAIHSATLAVIDKHGVSHAEPDIFDKNNTLLKNDWVIIGTACVVCGDKMLPTGKWLEV